MRAKLTWAALALTAGALAASSSPPVHVGLETGWSAPPLLLEILETVYDEVPESYFPLLNLLSSLPTDSTPESLLSSTLDLIETYSLLPSPSSLSTFHLALSLHASAPRIEAEYSWYESAMRENEVEFGVAGCEGWVEWRGKGFCNVKDLTNDMERSIEEGFHKVDEKSPPLPFDHTSTSSSATPSSPQAVIYYTPESTSAGELLGYLAHHASQYSDFTYVVRYLPPTSNIARKPLQLSGWGVEMVLKNTDYLVVDDRATRSNTDGQVIKGKDSNEIGIFSHVLGDDPWSNLSTPLTVQEIKKIGLRATALIMSSQNPLEALTELSQNFPKYSAALARNVEVPEEIQAKGRTIAVRGRGKQAVYINGKAFDFELNPYGLLKSLRSERQLALSLTSLGLTPSQSFSLLSDPVIGQAQVEDDVGEGLVDASDRHEGGDVIVFWNDIEKDERYQSWPVHVQGYMRPVRPGQYHTIRSNTFNLVFILDLAQASSLELITASISTMIQRKIPIRFGVVPTFEIGVNDDSAKMAKVFWYLVETFGREETTAFLQDVVVSTPRTVADPLPSVSMQIVRAAYNRLLEESSVAGVPFEDILADKDLDHNIQKTEKYLQRLLVQKTAENRDDEVTGGMFLNGRFTSLSGNWPTIVTQEMQLQLGFIQEEILAEALPQDISTLFYDLPSTTTRRSTLIIPNSDNKLNPFNLLDVFAGGEIEAKLSSEFVYPDGEGGTPISMWIVGDLDTEDGHQMVKDALRHLETAKCASRLGFIHTPTNKGTCPSGEYCLSTVIYQLLSRNVLPTVKPEDLLQLISDLEDSAAGKKVMPCPAGKIDEDFEDGAEEPIELCLKMSAEEREVYYQVKPLHGLTFGGWVSDDIARAGEMWKYGSEIAAKLGIRNGETHILVNGRLVGPIKRGTFTFEDFNALEAYEHRKRVKPVIDLLKTMYDDITNFDRSTLAGLISKVSSVITSAYKPLNGEGVFLAAQGPRTRYYERLDNGETSFKLGDENTALLRAAVVVNPISENAQKWAPLIKVLSDMPHVSVSVYLEPEVQIEEVKLKRFYRASIPSKLTFDVDGEVISPGVSFNHLPPTPIYTLGLDTPPSWIAPPKTSPYDLDNLQLSSISSPISITFQLKQLLIEGHAREGASIPPRGIQLQLTHPDGKVAADTQVMANLGYLQFRARPGYYSFTIRPGRGREVYDLESVGTEGWDSPSVKDVGDGVALGSFDGESIYPVFQRKEGMEKADVLIEAENSDGLTKQVFGKMKSILGISSEIAVAPTEHADINIFTVASGLLYERFASIMVLSVMKHTKSSVKFWFIENFLSPTFIEFIPKLAEEYGFQYEFVTYKWPHWLRAQTEKQRIIWAYKILFLDVLFPMSLDKVIFVDADQIVRTDMKELVDVDLHKRVYGYAPMGNSRDEMEGFRFWKTGYWKQVLRGRPYHISALYVVDLKRFRELGTGDRLRGQYHALSADPNSLANLDQDLPNSMQDTIPIWTLDQEWLWCQTWCSDESLAKAKTIDLCQNPLTKEPKLVRARQIPEWDVYDREISTFAARVSDAGDESGPLVVSVDELASEANREAAGEGPEEVEEKDTHIEDEL